MTLYSKIEKLNKQLSLTHSDSFGLASGKIGLSLYFYQLSRLENNREYEKLAEKYLNETVSAIGTVQQVDIKSGLAGIGLSIDYLVKNNFVNGNINSILKEIDDYLFRTLSTSKHYEQLDASTLIQFLYYFYVRLQDQKQGSENEYLFKELCVKTINNIYVKIEQVPFGRRLVYNVEQELPLFLYVLSRIRSLDFYNIRIDNILSELSPIVLSTIPILHSNKLYLLWAMHAVCKQTKINGWNEHIELLKRELNLEEIVSTELKNRNIFFYDGAVSIFLLTEAVKKELENTVCKFQQKLIEKIEQSEVWKLFEADLQYFAAHSRLLYGFCGVALLLATYKKRDL